MIGFGQTVYLKDWHKNWLYKTLYYTLNYSTMHVSNHEGMSVEVLNRQCEVDIVCTCTVVQRGKANSIPLKWRR